ncbi:MAG: C40 family peptidase [Immundisolibacter sp.]
MAADAAIVVSRRGRCFARGVLARQVRIFAWLLIAALGVAGCSHAPARLGGAPPIAAGGGSDNALAAEIAASLRGTPYRLGGDRPARGFDCSGLVQYSYGLIGISLPRTVAEQYRAAAPLDGTAPAVGDLLFFRIGGAISHVGIYYGDGVFVHAPSSGRVVTVSRLDDDYWRRRLAFVGRP